MKQTSLLDSFVKRTLTSQSQPSHSSNSQQKLQKQLNQPPKTVLMQQQNHDKKSQSFSQSNTKQLVYKTAEKIQKIQLIDQNNSDEEQLVKLKKKTQKIDNKKSAKSNKSKKRKQSDSDFIDGAQDQAEEIYSQEFIADEDEEYDNGSVEEDNFELEARKSKKKNNTGRKKNVQNKKTQNILTPIQAPKKSIQTSNQSQQPVVQETVCFDRSKFTDRTPQWAIPGNPNCRDKDGNNCKSPSYDQTTLFVPQHQLKNFTPNMRQYWKIKSENFDKIIFFKLGKFYELFYEDALIGNKLLDLKWMGTKMHVGFPQKSLERYTNQLIREGLKVVVVEQMQTPDQMNQRIKNDKLHGRKSQKTIRREVTQILTKGTVTCEDENVYLPNYLISVYRYQEWIAYSLLQVGTNMILVGIVQNFQTFKTILYQTHPSQLLYDPDNLPSTQVTTMKQNIDGMIFTKLINKNNLWHFGNSINQLKQLIDQKIINKPKILEELQNFDIITQNLIYSTLSGLFEYLHRVFKFQYIVHTAKFRFYEKEKAQTHMILDSQALQHLEIFQTIVGPEGSLFSKLDRTKTKFGRRLFRRWMTSPLLNIQQINQRLDAVKDLKNLGNELDNIQKCLSKLPDLQRIANKLYKYSVKNTSAATAIYFQDLNSSRLKQFNTFIKSLQESLLIMSMLQNHYDSFTSRRLKKLITIDRQGISTGEEKLIYFQDQDPVQNEEGQKIMGLLPDIVSQLLEFKQYIRWQDGKPYPKEGVMTLYDELVQKQKEIKYQLEREKVKLAKFLNCSTIQYVHIKQRYQLQIPQKIKNIPKQYTFSSRKAGYSRYLVPSVQQIVQKLQLIQKQTKSQMTIFVQFFFQQFKNKQNIWQRYINILAQIDCFAGIALYSNQRKSSRPFFTDKGYEVIDGVHPALYNMDFIPNDISFEDPIIILTGPNMGGKSTILRTACLLAIMAQMGCFVPCSSYKASIIDRIFTRIGASDKLQAGKSTFFIEMEETKSILTHATSHSLAIIDQLGRGTATYDGMALAHSVLNYLIHKIGCKCMFATHYHSLTEQFANMPGTCLKMMDYAIMKGQEDRIEFLYRLVSGKAEKSFGLNVAQLVGLPKQLINVARSKSEQMHDEIETKKKQVRIYEVLQEMCKS